MRERGHDLFKHVSKVYSGTEIFEKGFKMLRKIRRNKNESNIQQQYLGINHNIEKVDVCRSGQE